MRVVLFPSKITLATQKKSSNHHTNEPTTEFLDVISAIATNSTDFIENEVKDLSIQSQRDLQKKFFDEKKQVLAQLEALPIENWSEAEIILESLNKDLDEVYDHAIDYFEKENLVGVSEALARAKPKELQLFSSLRESIADHNTNGLGPKNDSAVELSDEFNTSVKKLATRKESHIDMNVPPSAASSMLENLSVVLQAGIHSASYVIKESYKSVENLIHGKKIPRNIAKLTGGVMGAAAGGVAAFFSAGALIGGALGTVAPIIGTIVGTVLGAVVGAAIGIATAKYSSKGTAKMVYGDKNPEKWQLNEKEKNNLREKHYDLNQVQAAIKAIRAEKDHAKDKIDGTKMKDEDVIHTLDDDLVRVKNGEHPNYKLGGKVFSFFKNDRENEKLDLAQEEVPVAATANRM